MTTTIGLIGNLVILLKRSVELDGISISGNTLLVLECKFRNTPFNYDMLTHLKESVFIFPDKYDREYYLFSKSVLTKEIKNTADDHIHPFELNDLFRK